MTIVREEENGDNGHHADGAWRGGRCPLSRDTRAGALARLGVSSDRSAQKDSPFEVTGARTVAPENVHQLGSNPAAPIMLRWHSIHIAVVLSAVSQ
jgi:hypothetical protein